MYTINKYTVVDIINRLFIDYLYIFYYKQLNEPAIVGMYGAFVMINQLIMFAKKLSN